MENKGKWANKYVKRDNQVDVKYLEYQKKVQAQLETIRNQAGYSNIEGRNTILDRGKKVLRRVGYDA